MTLFLDKETVATMTTEEAEKHLKRLTKKYNLDKPLNECFLEVWPELDEIVDTLLYLEDHIKHIQVVDHLNSIRHKVLE